MKNIFCCVGFEHRVTDAGQRGIAVLVLKTTDGIKFRLQSRGIAFEDENKIHPISVNIKINVSCECGLRFCPFCGRKLQELVKDSPEYFEELADKHKKLQTIK